MLGRTQKQTGRPSVSVCLITGGAGNLACQLSRYLADRFQRFVLVDRAKAPVGSVSPSSIFVQGDLLDVDRMEDLFKKYRPSSVIHLASLLSGSCEQDRPLAWRVNMDGTFHLMETALRHGTGTVLFASSVATFGDPVPEVLTDETPQWPETLYGVTKMAAERLGGYYSKRHGLDFRCLRLPTTISRNAPSGAVSALISRAFIEAVHSGGFIFTMRPDIRLAAIYIQDVLRAFGDLLAAPESSLHRRVYNLNGFTTTPGEIAGVLRSRLPQVSLEFQPDDAVDKVFSAWPGTIDDSAARRDWAWCPAWNLQRTADDFLRLLQAEPKPQP